MIALIFFLILSYIIDRLNKNVKIESTSKSKLKTRSETKQMFKRVRQNKRGVRRSDNSKPNY